MTTMNLLAFLHDGEHDEGEGPMFKLRTTALALILSWATSFAGAVAQTYEVCPNCGGLRLAQPSQRYVEVLGQPRIQPGQPLAGTGYTTLSLDAFSYGYSWPVDIDPQAQAEAEHEAQVLANRGTRGYRFNGHPGGTMAGYATGTGYSYTYGTVPTCRPRSGDGVLVAAAVAPGHDQRGRTVWFGVRAWKNHQSAVRDRR